MQLSDVWLLRSACAAVVAVVALALALPARAATPERTSNTVAQATGKPAQDKPTTNDTTAYWAIIDDEKKPGWERGGNFGNLIKMVVSKGRRQEAVDLYEKALSPKYLGLFWPPSVPEMRDTQVRILGELGKYTEMRRKLADMEATDPSPQRRRACAFWTADSYRTEGKTNEALDAYESLFVKYPDVNENWMTTQTRIIEMLIGLNRREDALKAAHMLYDAADSGGTADFAVQRMVEMLKLIDNGTNRADALLAMHRFGPKGKDGKPGTADDPAPVLASIGYPDGTARRKAFEAIAPKLGDRAAAALHRGYGYLFACDPKTAMAHFADALRRCQAYDAAGYVKVLLRNGVWPASGYKADTAEYQKFVSYGPNGPDGQPGTADDLKDPFPSVGLDGLSEPQGGLVPLSAANADQLRELTLELREQFRQAREGKRKGDILNAYRRICETLVMLDREETLAWILNTLSRETDPGLRSQLLSLGRDVAKMNRLHVDGVVRFDAEVARRFPAKK